MIMIIQREERPPQYINRGAVLRATVRLASAKPKHVRILVIAVPLKASSYRLALREGPRSRREKVSGPFVLPLFGSSPGTPGAGQTKLAGRLLDPEFASVRLTALHALPERCEFPFVERAVQQLEPILRPRQRSRAQHRSSLPLAGQGQSLVTSCQSAQSSPCAAARSAPAPPGQHL